MNFKPLVVGIGGTARPNSTSERAVRETLQAAERLGANTRFFDGDFITRLSLYSPERSLRTADEQTYVDAVRRCDGIIVGTPGYHGSLSAPIKNILDFLEDMARDDRPYLEGRAFGCVVTAYGWQACGTTLVSLRMIAHALRAWPTPFGATLNASMPLFDADGQCLDGKTSSQLAVVAGQVVDFARWRAAGTAYEREQG